MEKKENLSEQAVDLATSGRSKRLFTTLQVAKRLAIRSMTLMRWVVNGDVSCPAVHILTGHRVYWLWNEEEIRSVAALKKWVFRKRTHWRAARR
jgi:hypothetical protein